MKNEITLDFYNDKMDISVPSNYSELLNSVSKMLFFSPSDTAELILSYKEDDSTVYIKNNEDYIKFINHPNSKEISIEVSEQSRIYMEGKKSYEEEQIMQKEIDSLQKEKELKAKKNFEIKAKLQKELKDIDTKINTLNKKKKEIQSQINKGDKETIAFLKDSDNKIKQLQEKLGKIDFLPNEKLKPLSTKGIDEYIKKTKTMTEKDHDKIKGNYINMLKKVKGVALLAKFVHSARPNIIQQIYEEINSSLIMILKEFPLAKFIQNFYPALDNQTKIAFLEIIKVNFKELVQKQNGHSALKIIITKCSTEKEKKIIIEGIENELSDLSKIKEGVRLLVFIIKTFGNEAKPIYDCIKTNFNNLSMNGLSVNLIKQAIQLNKNKEIKEEMIHLLSIEINNLIANKNLKGLFETIIDLWEEEDILKVFQNFKNNYVNLSTNKLASLILGKLCIKNKKIFDDYMDEIKSSGKLQSIMNNENGIVLLQQILNALTNEEQRTFAELLQSKLGKIAAKFKKQWETNINQVLGKTNS